VAKALAPIFAAAVLMGIAVSGLEALIGAYLTKTVLLVVLVVAGAVSYAILFRYLMPTMAADFIARFRRGSR
jgi:hypothetical protein